eukprot:TRINITY_DN12548_c0_g2_i2.p1 TRINITY_DN12548_c0_g2~~TRINITY_DN12548_c0_g2_i2.p1  ORF type:complete len:502 (+),score=144.21 TRINITY_DN12548_c0_g2_i2:203-1708(+)
MSNPPSSTLYGSGDEYAELFWLLPKHQGTVLLDVERFVEFIKAIATASCEKNAYTLPARARRQLSKKDHLSLEAFGDCVRGALWTKIQQKLVFVKDVMASLDCRGSSGSGLEWSEFQRGFVSLLDSPDSTDAPTTVKVLSEVWAEVIQADPRPGCVGCQGSSMDLYRLGFLLAHTDIPVQRVHTQLEFLRTLFEMYDMDQSGCLTVDELTAMLTSGGHSPGPSLMGEVMRFADKSGDGTIDFPEFVNALCRDQATHQMIAKPLMRYSSMFKSFDTNGNGLLSLAEFRIMYDSHDFPLHKSIKAATDPSTLFKVGDKDQNRMIDFKEFVSLMTNATAALQQQVTSQISSMLEAFLLFSQGGDSISQARLASALRMVGLRVTEEQVRMYWRQVSSFDNDQSNTIELPEFITLMMLMQQANDKGLLEKDTLLPQNESHEMAQTLCELKSAFSLYLNKKHDREAVMVVQPLEEAEFARHVTGHSDPGYVQVKQKLAEERGVRSTC